MRAFKQVTQDTSSRNHYSYGSPENPHREGSIPDLVMKYKASHFWKDLMPLTQKNYNKFIPAIWEWSAQNKHPHIKNIGAADIIKFLQYYDGTPVSQRRAKVVLSLLWSTAVQYGFIKYNIIKDIKLRRKNKKARKLVLWTEEDVKAFVASADAAGRGSMGTAVLIAYNTAQRQGDVLSMRRRIHYVDGCLKVTQSKTAKKVLIPVMESLRARLETLPEDHDFLVTNEYTGKKWDSEHFSKIFRKIADKAGLVDHWFMELRHSNIYDLSQAGCTKVEIAAISGHSLKTIDKMLQEHYLELRDAKLAEQAIEKLEAYKARGATHGMHD